MVHHEGAHKRVEGGELFAGRLGLHDGARTVGTTGPVLYVSTYEAMKSSSWFLGVLSVLGLELTPKKAPPSWRG